MKSLLIAIAIIFTLPNQLFATNCPPPPVPLRLLTEKAQVIVVGRVISSEEKSLEQFSARVAEFEIHQILKGVVKNKRIQIYMDSWIEEQMKNEGTDGVRLLAFLSINEENNNMYFPTSFQSGYKILNEAGISNYRQRIKELQAINTLLDENRRNELTADWLIDCASNASTYWEGAYDLSPYGGFLHYYDYKNDVEVTRWTLTAQQKQRIRAIVLKQPTLSYLELGLITTVVDGPDPELLRHMISSLKGVDAEFLHQQRQLMIQIASMMNRSDLQNSLDEIAALDYDEEYVEKANRIAQTFVHKLK